MVNVRDDRQGGYDTERVLEAVAGEIGIDIAAFASFAEPNRRARWIGVFGASSSRMARMEVKPGVGAAGMAVRLGVPLEASAEKNAHMLSECPVMLAERLNSALAVPFPAKPGSSESGVLLLGRRERQPFSEREIRQIFAKMPLWIELLQR